MSRMASQITSFTIVYSTVYSGADQSKHQSSASLAFVWGIHRGLVNSPHKWPVTRKMFPFDDVIMLWENHPMTQSKHILWRQFDRLSSERFSVDPVRFPGVVKLIIILGAFWFMQLLGLPSSDGYFSLQCCTCISVWYMWFYCFLHSTDKMTNRTYLLKTRYHCRQRYTGTWISEASIA